MCIHAAPNAAIYVRCYVTPLLGAYIADAHWGRYKTICWAVVIALIGHIVLIISGIPGVIETKGAIGVFSLALVITGFGELHAQFEREWRA